MAGHAAYQQLKYLLAFTTAQDTMGLNHFTTISMRRLSLERVAKAVKAVNPFRLSKRSPHRHLNKDVHFQYDRTADGVWAPSCGHDMKLYHFAGPHPFKYVKCHCERLLCPDDRTSEILTPIPSLELEVYEERFQGQRRSKESRYCQLCRACGLTHRGKTSKGRIEFPTMPCVCGQISSEEPMYFYIGDNAAYQNDADAVTVDVRLTQRLDASQRCKSNRIPLADWVPSSPGEIEKFRLALDKGRPTHVRDASKPETKRNKRPKQRACGSAIYVLKSDSGWDVRADVSWFPD